jgi:hypothetical protein
MRTDAPSNNFQPVPIRVIINFYRHPLKRHSQIIALQAELHIWEEIALHR